MYKRSQLNIERSTGAVKTERLKIPSVRRVDVERRKMITDQDDQENQPGLHFISSYC